MNYEQAIKFIHDRQKFGTKLGLENIGELMHRLGNPHQKLRFIHVAGTNGKGSTSAYIANILMANGKKTGMYISPYVHSFNERIQINNTEISNDALARHTRAVADVISDTFAPTEFEVVTAIGFLYFLEQGCDYVVLEVGLGGRFDATNVIPAPEVSVITSISIDHTELLGDTVEQIAFEKCGIIKTGSHLAAYPDNQEEANKVIIKTAKEKNVPLKMGEKSSIEIISRDISGTRFIYEGIEYEISMLGEHQVYNAVTAITAAHLLGIPIENIKAGLRKTRFRGRFEVIHKNPTVIVDGAHNYSGVLALRESLTSYFKDKKIILVMGMLKDKEYKKCVAEIAPIAYCFIATEPDNPRLLSAQNLAEVAKKYNNNVLSFEDKFDAIKKALEIADKNSIICIGGSLYLIGGIKIEE